MPDPPALTLTRPTVSRHQITAGKKFEKHRPYSDWQRGVYDAASFDAYSTEFRLAELFDTSPDIQAWARITPTVPLSIPYTIGAAQRAYWPDFLVIDSARVRWIIEGKADSEISDPRVIAKRDAAKAWINVVNAAPEVTERYGYLLASEATIVAAAGNWAALKAASQTHS